MSGFDGSELNEEKGDRVMDGAIDELNDSERFISGGESSEETVRRWLGGVLHGGFAMVQVGCGEVCWLSLTWAGGPLLFLSPPVGSNYDEAFGTNENRV